MTTYQPDTYRPPARGIDRIGNSVTVSRGDSLHFLINFSVIALSVLPAFTFYYSQLLYWSDTSRLGDVWLAHAVAGIGGVSFELFGLMLGHLMAETAKDKEWGWFWSAFVAMLFLYIGFGVWESVHAQSGGWKFFIVTAAGYLFRALYYQKADAAAQQVVDEANARALRDELTQQRREDNNVNWQRQQQEKREEHEQARIMALIERGDDLALDGGVVVEKSVEARKNPSYMCLCGFGTENHRALNGHKASCDVWQAHKAQGG